MKINAIKHNNNTLSEALGQPYPYNWSEKSAHKYEATYETLMIAFMTRTMHRSDWEIAFDVGGREDLTGDGDAFKILSTVVAATREWWAEQDPAQVKTIRFSGKNDSHILGGRASLYRRFATQFANDIGFVARDGSDRTDPNTTNYILTNPNFNSNINEDGKIVKGVNTTIDVQPGETQRQSAKFGNKLNSKGEPPLLNAKARKNSSSHVLANLGLAEAAKNEGTNTADDITQLQARLTSQYNLKDLWLSDMATRGAFEISSIIVNKDDQKAGTGTAVMQELIAYADQNDKIVVLDPALKDKNHGTSSQSRLRKFYKRFGFIENKGRNKNYEFRNIMIRYPQSKKVTEAVQGTSYGYKAMNYNPETGEITSGADSRVTKGIKIHKGMTLKMPGKGIFMSTNRKYIEDYYSGHNDHEVLVKFKFDSATITSGNLTDKENEFTVPSATVVDFKVVNNLEESQQMNKDIKKPRPEDTLGVARADMPQIHANHYPELFNYLKQHGATISKGVVHASELKAVQGEFSDAGVEKMMNKGVADTGTTRKKPLIVSSDNYIIDGHHRWLAAYNLEEEVPIIKFGLPVKELLQLVRDFKHTTYRGIYKEKEVRDEKKINDRGHNRN